MSLDGEIPVVPRSASDAKLLLARILHPSGDRPAYTLDGQSVGELLQLTRSKKASLQAEAYETVIGSYDEFLNLYTSGKGLQSGIEDLLERVDRVQSTLHDHGLISQVAKKVSTLQALKEEVNVTRDIVHVVEQIQKVMAELRAIQNSNTSIDFADVVARTKTAQEALERVTQDYGDIRIIHQLRTDLEAVREQTVNRLQEYFDAMVTFKAVDTAENDPAYVSRIAIVHPELKQYSTSISIQTVMDCMSQLGVLDRQLFQLKRNVFKHVIDPIFSQITTSRWDVHEQRQDDAYILSASSTPTDDDAASSPTDIFRWMLSILQFYYQHLFLNTAFALSFGNFVLPELYQHLITHALAPSVPTSIADLKKFHDIQEQAKHFEEAIMAWGFARQQVAQAHAGHDEDLELPHKSRSREDSSLHPLSLYVANLDVHFGKKKRERILFEGRKIMLREVHDLQPVQCEPDDTQAGNATSSDEAADNDEETDEPEYTTPKGDADHEDQDDKQEQEWEWSQNEEKEGRESGQMRGNGLTKSGKTPAEALKELLAKPASLTFQCTQTPQLLAMLIDSNLAETEEPLFQQYPSSKQSIREAVVDVLDLYRAVVPIQQKQHFQYDPEKAMVFRNDCSHLSREIKRCLGEKGCENDEKIKTACSQLNNLAQSVFNATLQREMTFAERILSKADGLEHSALPGNKNKYIKVIQTTLLHVQDFAAAIKPVITLSDFFEAMGKVCEKIVSLVLDDVWSFVDIGEDESHCLADLMREVRFDGIYPESATTATDGREPSTFSTLSNQDTRQVIDIYIPTWQKFIKTRDLLELSFKDIMYRFRHRQLLEFTPRELEHLICALFADTELRQKNLREIKGGHPETERDDAGRFELDGRAELGTGYSPFARDSSSSTVSLPSSSSDSHLPTASSPASSKFSQLFSNLESPTSSIHRSSSAQETTKDVGNLFSDLSSKPKRQTTGLSSLFGPGDRSVHRPEATLPRPITPSGAFTRQLGQALGTGLTGVIGKVIGVDDGEVQHTLHEQQQQPPEPDRHTQGWGIQLPNADLQRHFTGIGSGFTGLVGSVIGASQEEDDKKEEGWNDDGDGWNDEWKETGPEAFVPVQKDQPPEDNEWNMNEGWDNAWDESNAQTEAAPYKQPEEPKSFSATETPTIPPPTTSPEPGRKPAAIAGMRIASQDTVLRPTSKKPAKPVKKTAVKKLDKSLFAGMDQDVKDDITGSTATSSTQKESETQREEDAWGEW